MNTLSNLDFESKFINENLISYQDTPYENSSKLLWNLHYENKPTYLSALRYENKFKFISHFR